MLTADLIRATVRKGVVRPTWLRTDQPALHALAQQLIDSYDRGIGKARAELTEEHLDIVGDSPDYLIARGLVKLLDDRSTWQVESPLPPVELRERLFDTMYGRRASHEARALTTNPSDGGAGARPGDEDGDDEDRSNEDRSNEGGGRSNEGGGRREPSRDAAQGEGHHPPEAPAGRSAGRRSGAEVVAQVARELGVDVELIEAAMYADLRDEERLVSFEAIDAPALLDRYNLSLAQAVLLRATELELTVPADRPAQLRALFRALKFHQLMHRTSRVAGDGVDAYVVRVDGPLSLFSLSQRYGVQMAQFLPVVACLERWSLRATLRWPNHESPLELALDERSGLRSHRRLTGTWRSDELTMLVERLEAHRGSWVVDEAAHVVDLNGQDVLVPDLALRCSRTGRVAWVELVGYWRRGWLERRIEVLRAHGPPNLVLCVSRRLAAEGDLEGLGGAVVPFAKVVSASAVVKAADAVAVVPAD